jgi:hypothetical protein
LTGSAIVAGSIIWFLVWASPFFTWTTDDAFISYRFAENLAAGDGLVFNAGERVEGFSNLLWTLVLSAGARLGMSPEVVSKLLASIALILIVRISDSIARRGGMGVFWRLGLAFAITTDISTVLYALSGLETVFYSFLILCFAKLVADHFQTDENRTGMILMVSVLIAMSRPEGVLYPMAFLGAYLYRTIKKGRRPSTSDIWRWVAFAAFAGALLALRYGYYGDVLPNTYYAKPSGSFGREFPVGGIAYLDRAVRDLGFVWPALAILFAFQKKSEPWGAYRSSLGLAILPLVLFAFYAGRDWMPNSRFLVPIFPLIYLLGWSVLQNMGTRVNKPRLMAAATLVILLFSSGYQYRYRSSILRDRDELPYDLMTAGDNARTLGLWLEASFEPSCRLATKRIGVVPYYAKLVTLDLYGLIDKSIAGWIHDAGTFGSDGVGARVAEHILARNPELIILHSRTREPFEPHGKQEEALNERLGGSYELVGEYDFSASYINRLFIRNDAVTSEELERLRRDMKQGLRDSQPGVPQQDRVRCPR